MRVTRFILALHSHQPVGNFPWVFEEAYAQAYRPFLDALERHPAVRVVFHYSGPLLDWFEKEHPDFLKRLVTLVRRGQVECMGGGYYEPILAMIPDRDAAAQLRMMSQNLARLGLDGGQAVAGIWLAERVWEPQLPSLLASVGIRYTVVDDHHLKLVGIPEEDRFGYYLTEDRGRSVALFPSSKALRYLVPFKPVEEVVETLKGFQSDRQRVVVLADDGEKFGLWPGTNRWVYEEGWLEAFFKALEQNRDWLQGMTFREALETLPPLGRVALPGGSYEEMMQWSGGTFRNFLLKYPEADAMHKKMLWLSRRLNEADPQAKAAPLVDARRHLYMAQGNDPYWHGVFGGLYLRHLRRAVFTHLLEAERILDRRKKSRRWIEVETLDIDADQRPELLVRSPDLTLLIDPDQGGQLVEMSDKRSNLNLLDTLTRRPEPYHERLRARQEVPLAAPVHTPSSIHERHEGDSSELADSLVYDSYRRRAGLMDHLFSPETPLRAFATGAAQELGDFVEGPFEGRLIRSGGTAQAVLTRSGRVTADGAAWPVKLSKTIQMGVPKERSVRVAYRLTNLASRHLTFLFGSESSLNLKDAHVNRIGEAQGVRRFSVTDPASHLRVSWVLSAAARLWHFPLETVSDSERGLERNYQGVSLTWLWPLALPPKGSWTVRWEMSIDEADEKT